MLPHPRYKKKLIWVRFGQTQTRTRLNIVPTRAATGLTLENPNTHRIGPPPTRCNYRVLMGKNYIRGGGSNASFTLKKPKPTLLKEACPKSGPFGLGKKPTRLDHFAIPLQDPASEINTWTKHLACAMLSCSITVILLTIQNALDFMLIQADIQTSWRKELFI